MWSSKDSFVSTITPTSFCFSVVSSRGMGVLSVIEYSVSPTLFLPIVICLHLLGYNTNNHLSLHCSRAFRSCSKIPWHQYQNNIVLNILMSSANKNVSDLISSVRSFMYNTNS